MRSNNRNSQAPSLIPIQRLIIDGLLGIHPYLRTVGAASRVLMPLVLVLVLVAWEEEPADRLCTPEINSQTYS